MHQVRDLINWLERFAPPSLAESWDNVGLLLGDLEAPCRKVMTCLTLTSETAAEAALESADLVVSHHPIFFKGTKTLRADRPATSPAWTLARAGIALYSPHTAFDNAPGGINDGLARRLGLVDVGPLRLSEPKRLHKVVVFCPRGDRDAVLNAAFAAGAGRIGAYGECSFTAPGVGTFFGDEGTNPTIGQVGRRESVREGRVEVICTPDRLVSALEAIRAAHSYEEPAIDVYPVQAPDPRSGVGRQGRLPVPVQLSGLAASVARTLASPGLQFAGDPTGRVERVAICCGAGDDLLADAAKAGADVLLTGEARFHRALEAESLGIGLIVAGHHATERPGVEDLAESLAAVFPGMKAWSSRRERDPLRMLTN